MRIQRLELSRYIPFILNDVACLEMDAPGDIQNILGSNGCGKTSLLQELNPNPAVRTDFGDGGYKRITLTHNGSEYLLSSNFINPSSPHSFLKNGYEEMNPSGTTSVQEDLIQRELGYTNTIHNLCYHTPQTRLSAMTVAARKMFLSTMHPSEMRMILDKHKALLSRLKGRRDNLIMLQERRTELAAQLMEPSQKEALQTENDKLTHQLGVVVDAIHKLNHQKTALSKEKLRHGRVGHTRNLADIKKAKADYPKYSLIPRDRSIESCRQEAVSENVSITTQIETIAQQIQSITLEIDKYEEHIRHNDAQGILTLIEENIASLKSDIADLEVRQINNPFDTYAMPTLPQHISKMTDMVGIFIGYTEKIPSRQAVQRMQAKLEFNQQQLNRCLSEREHLQIRQDEIEKRLLAQSLDEIPEGCHECILFREYTKSLTAIRMEYDTNSIPLTEITRKIQRLTWLVEARQNKLLLFNQVVPHLQMLSNHLREYPFLKIPFQDLDILATLRQNPSLLLMRLETHYQKSRDHHTRLLKQEELGKVLLDYDRLKKPSEFSRQFLQSIVSEKHQMLSQLRCTHKIQSEKQTEIRQFLVILEAYEQELKRLDDDRKGFVVQEIQATLDFENELCDRMILNLNQAKTKIVSRLTDIDRVLREQEALSARYHQEVVANIVIISEKEKKEALIEKALSPTTGIPYEDMVQFINAVITKANILINDVFSYPYEFIPIGYGDPLDYKFRMRMGESNTIVPDISRTSMAQMEMADLAFAIALIIERKQSDYPLYLDEVGKTFDTYHKQKLIDFLKSIVDIRAVSQLFLVNHHFVIFSGLSSVDMVVLNENNIVLPQNYNEHITFRRYG